MTVRDPAFAVVKELDSAELARFARLWASKSEISIVAGPSQYYKLDVSGGDAPGRWLYDTNGRATRSSPESQPIFQLQDVEAFNELIGAKVLASAASAKGDAEIRAEIEQLCRQVLCRKPTRISLKLPEGESFEMLPASPTPIVSGGLITVHPGETVYVEARVEAGRLVGLTAVPTNSHPEKTLVFELQQATDIGDGTGMTLEVASPFAEVLKYRLGMMLPRKNEVVKTSACPLHRGRTTIEHWPHPIYQIVATDFRVVDPASDATETCE